MLFEERADLLERVNRRVDVVYTAPLELVKVTLNIEQVWQVGEKEDWQLNVENLLQTGDSLVDRSEPTGGCHHFNHHRQQHAEDQA